MKLGLSKEELLARRRGIGGSDAGAIVAGGEAWLDLWLDKTARKEPADLSDILPVQMGLYTEPLNCYWYTKMTGREVTMRGEKVVHPTIPYLFANLDGLTTTSAGHPAYIDFKHIGRPGDQITLRYTAQCTHCAIILTALRPQPVDWWVLSTFVGNSRWELEEQEIDPFFAADYLAKCREFWAFVEADEEPPGAPPLPVPPPRKLRTITLEGECQAEWPNWAVEMIAHLGTFEETWSSAQRHAESRDQIKTLLPEDVGLLTRGRVKILRDRAGAVRSSLTKEKASG